MIKVFCLTSCLAPGRAADKTEVPVITGAQNSSLKQLSINDAAP